MAKKTCPPGSYRDSLLKFCFSIKNGKPITTELPLSAVVERTNSTPPPQSLALWICVLVATLGSILALALWFVLYRRQTRLRITSEEAEPEEQPLQKIEKQHPLPSERNCPHLHLGVQTGFKWEEDFAACRDPVEHFGRDGGQGLPTCSAMREHTIPLPATELGGTALVTTKTV